ncbi:MAG: FADH(2)-oxidizing methylenetetrahydrofolate--tRNA-(uracil(54)-C(5))-methyltransferase TrmFO [Acidobacteriota bacterium]
MEHVVVVGGGLAGSEAAYKLAQNGISVKLFEMRPLAMTPAHRTGFLAELICSNSLKSESLDTAQGLLKAEMRQMGSLVLDCAEKCRVAAGSALAVDRDLLGAMVTEIIESHPLIEVVREEVTEIPKDGVVIVASGPLTAGALANDIQSLTGSEYLHFYDAVAPIVAADSVDMNRAFRGSRYGKGSDDYINCPMTEEEYTRFCDELVKADPVPIHEADRDLYFNACMPIEEIARRGPETLKFGPMRPVGLPDPVTGRISAAVVQLRNENKDGSMLGLVGFQTRMKWGEQERVLRLIPALENAVFLRLGVMHRNTFINSPQLLNESLEFRTRPGLFFAGQITGVEGYMESAASGIWVGINTARLMKGMKPLTLPPETMLGSLFSYVSNAEGKSFQPMNANFGLLPPLEDRIRNKKLRNSALSERSLDILTKLSEEFSD